MQYLRAGSNQFTVGKQDSTKDANERQGTSAQTSEVNFHHENVHTSCHAGSQPGYGHGAPSGEGSLITVTHQSEPDRNIQVLEQDQQHQPWKQTHTSMSEQQQARRLDMMRQHHQDFFLSKNTFNDHEETENIVLEQERDQQSEKVSFSSRPHQNSSILHQNNSKLDFYHNSLSIENLPPTYKEPRQEARDMSRNKALFAVDPIPLPKENLSMMMGTPGKLDSSLPISAGHPGRLSHLPIESAKAALYTSHGPGHGHDNISMQLSCYEMIGRLQDRLGLLEQKISGKDTTNEMVKNLVYERFPSFERRLTQLQIQVSLLLKEINPKSESSLGAIRLQTTPRHEETLSSVLQQEYENGTLMSKEDDLSSIVLVKKGKRSKFDRSICSSKRSTPEPEDDDDDGDCDGNIGDGITIDVAINPVVSSSPVKTSHMGPSQPMETRFNLHPQMPLHATANSQDTLARMEQTADLVRTSGKKTASVEDFQVPDNLINLAQRQQAYAQETSNFMLQLPPSLMDESGSFKRETVHSIEDATGRLSQLVRMMDESGRIMLKEDALTVRSYKSGSQGLRSGQRDHNEKSVSHGHGNSLNLLRQELCSSMKDQSSLGQSQLRLENLLKDENKKLHQQLNDIKKGTLAKQLSRAKEQKPFLMGDVRDLRAEPYSEVVSKQNSVKSLLFPGKKSTRSQQKLVINPPSEMGAYDQPELLLKGQIYQSHKKLKRTESQDLKGSAQSQKQSRLVGRSEQGHFQRRKSNMMDEILTKHTMQLKNSKFSQDKEAEQYSDGGLPANPYQNTSKDGGAPASKVSLKIDRSFRSLLNQPSN